MRRIPELDGLRGMAAALVVAHHLWPDLLFFGWAAVDLFFVLSGYLITGIILKNGGPGFLWAFYARRSLRIWPIYYLVILILLTCTQPESGALLYYLFYLQNVPAYWGGHVPVWHEFVHAWTLALEEQFYLIWPALLLFFRRPARLVGIALAVAVGSILLRWGGVAPNLLAARCDGFALGGLLAGLRSTGWSTTTIWLAAAAALIGGLASLFWSLATTGAALREYQPPDVTASTLLSFALVTAVALMAGGRLTAFLRTGPLVYLGTISYGLYLYHYPIILRSYSLTLRLGLKDSVAEPFFLAALSLAVAVMSWHLIEKPILRLKDWVPYHRAIPVRN